MLPQCTLPQCMLHIEGGACYISSNCSGKYRFKRVTVADKQCEPVIAGMGVFVWVGAAGMHLCDAHMTSARVYHIDRKTAIEGAYCTKIVHDNTVVA